MTHDADPTPVPGSDDPAIEAATDQVIETWNEAVPGKDPTADAADFERMREGLGELAGRETAADLKD